MFPSTLHKNIVQLDRQISLLEKECESMEAETKRKNAKSEAIHSKSSRISNTQMNSPKVRVSSKRNDGLKKSTISPTHSSRIHSSSSLLSQCRKSLNGNSETFIGKKVKSNGGNTYLQGCACQTANQTQCNLKRNHKRGCSCKEKVLPDLPEKEHVGDDKGAHVLHKEVLIPNPGSTIEVIVTQKSKSKENLPVVRSVNVASVPEKIVENCKCQGKGPKWSEILFLEAVKNGEKNSGDSAKNEIITGVEDLISPTLNFNSKVQDPNIYNMKNNENTKKPIFEEPVKLSPELIRNKIVSEISRMPLEGIESILVNNYEENKKKQQSDLEYSNKNTHIDVPSKDFLDKSQINVLWASSGVKKDFFHKLQKSNENLLKEKEKLVEDLSVKENTLKVMKKREEEYVSLITTLKSSLEKSKEKAEEGAKAVKELSNAAAKLDEQNKISEAIKKKHIDLQRLLERYALENDKLQTQIKLLKLEAQKHDVLLAGKEAEIIRYKEEIKNFQQQLSDHIELLKSSSQGLDVEKIMEVIMQQSQIFFRNDLNAEDQKENSKPNPLVHSSPTSTKSSVLNSSWNRISSIHERERSRGEPHFVVNFKEGSNEKEFFQVFGDSSSTCSKTPKTPETLFDKLSDKREMKNSSSFTSCESLRENSDSSTSKSVPEKNKKPALEVVSKVALDKVQSNIDELLENLKLKWSKEIFESSGADSTIKDFLNDTQISSIPQ